MEATWNQALERWENCDDTCETGKQLSEERWVGRRMNAQYVNEILHVRIPCCTSRAFCRSSRTLALPPFIFHFADGVARKYRKSSPCVSCHAIGAKFGVSQAPKFAPVGGNLLTCSCIVERARKARKGFEVTYSIEYIHRPTQLWHFPHFSNAPMVADVDPSEYDRPERVRPRRRSHPARPRQGMY